MNAVSPKARQLFSHHFFATRAEYADTPTSQFRAAGKPTKTNPHGEDEMWWLANGPSMVQRWMDWREQSGWRIWETPDGRPAIELEMYPSFDGVRVRMFVDRIMTVPATGSLVIVDLKSGRRTPASDLQLGFYRTGLWQTFGVNVEFGAYWMARTGELTPIQDITRFTPGLMSAWLHKFVAARDAGIFLPNLSEKCRACGVNQHCHAYGGSKSATDPDSVAALEVPQP